MTSTQITVNQAEEDHTVSENTMTESLSNFTEAQQHELLRLRDKLERAPVKIDTANDHIPRLGGERDRHTTRNKTISDSFVAPQPFIGNVTAQDPPDWLEYFER